MLGATRRWLRRNRTPLAVGVGVLGAGYVATQYVWTKLAEARERRSSEQISRENLRRRFEHNQEDCTFTVLALLPTATENILKALPVENITHELQLKKAERLARGSQRLLPPEGASSEISSGSPSVAAAEDDGKSLRSFQSESYVHASQSIEKDSAGDEPTVARGVETPRKSKAQLWAELKVASVTRTFTLVYTLSLLTILTRIQLNLLGRRSYLSSVVTLASYPLDASEISLENREDGRFDEHAYGGGDFEANRRYLAFSWWLLQRGWRENMHKVEAAVKDVFGPVDPREDIPMARLSELTLQVRRQVEGATQLERRTSKWLGYLLPPREQESLVLRESGMLSTSTELQPASPSSEKTLRRLLDETSDLIDSPTFSHVLTQLLDAAFSTLIDVEVAEQAFNVQSAPSSANPAASLYQRSQSAPGAKLSVTLPPFVLEQEGDGERPSEAPPKSKVANILAVMTRQAHAVGRADINGNGNDHNLSGGVGMGDGAVSSANEYLRAIDSCHDLDAFAAVIFSSNFELEDLSSSGAGARAGAARAVGGFDSAATQAVSDQQPGSNVLLAGGKGVDAADPGDTKTAAETPAPALPPRPTPERQQLLQGQQDQPREREEGGDDVKQQTLEDAWGKATASGTPPSSTLAAEEELSATAVTPAPAPAPAPVSPIPSASAAADRDEG